MYLAVMLGSVFAVGIVLGFNFASFHNPPIFVFLCVLWVIVYHINNKSHKVQKMLIPILMSVFFLWGAITGSSLTDKRETKVVYEEFAVVAKFARGYIIETESKLRAYYIPDRFSNNIRMNNRYSGRIAIKPLIATDMETKFRLMLYSRNVFNASDIHVFGYAGKRDIPIVEKLPSSIKQYIEQKLTPLAFAYTSALIFGGMSYFDKESLDRILSLGILHLFAVSGMHVGILVGIITQIWVILNMTKRNSLIATVVIIFLYCLLAGFAPSISRSTVMFFFIAVASYSGRFSNPVNTIFVSFLILLAVAPHWIFSPGFQLSYTATLGIILYANYVKEVFKEQKLTVWAKITALFMISGVAFVFTLPFQLYYFNSANALSIIFTPLFSSLITFSLAVSFVFILVSPVPFLSEYLAFILDRTAIATEFLTNVSVSYINFEMPNNIAVSGVLIFVTTVILAFISMMLIKRKLLYGYIAAIISVTVLPIISFMS